MANTVQIIATFISSLLFIGIVTLILLAASGYFNPVDCKVSDWGPCDPITGKRTRTVITPAKYGGKECGLLEEACPVNCQMSAWGPCTNDKQTRTITTPAKNGGTACGSLEQACVTPFTAESGLSTTPQEFLTTYYLDRHPEICADKPINSFKLSKISGTTQAKIDYKCSSGLDAGTKTSKASPSFSGPYTVHLSSAPVACETGEVLSNLGVKNEGGYKFKYDCIKSTKNLACRELQTPKANAIEAHNVACGADEVLSSMKVKDHGDDTVSYIYNCCKKALPAL